MLALIDKNTYKIFELQDNVPTYSYEYDEAVEGVKFEDLPADYVCPLCGVEKDMFNAE